MRPQKLSPIQNNAGKSSRLKTPVKILLLSIPVRHGTSVAVRHIFEEAFLH